MRGRDEVSICRQRGLETFLMKTPHAASQLNKAVEDSISLSKTRNLFNLVSLGVLPDDTSNAFGFIWVPCIE